MYKTKNNHIDANEEYMYEVDKFTSLSSWVLTTVLALHLFQDALPFVYSPFGLISVCTVMNKSVMNIIYLTFMWSCVHSGLAIHLVVA